MPYISSRRSFMKHAGLALAGAQLAPWLKFVSAAALEDAIVETSAGKVRGVVVDGMKIALKDEKGGMATITIPDVMQSNGVIHVISSVAMPK